MTNTPGPRRPLIPVHLPMCTCEDCAYDAMLIAELDADNRAERRERGF